MLCVDAVLIAYFGTGAATYIALYVFLRRRGFPKEARAIFVNLLGPEHLFFGSLFWPIRALLILAEYWRVVSKRKEEQERAADRAMKMEREGKYAGLSMDALLEAQRRVLQKTDEPPR